MNLVISSVYLDFKKFLSIVFYKYLNRRLIHVSLGSVSCICFFLLQCKSLLMVVLFSQSHVLLFETPWTAARRTSLSFTVSQSLFKLMPIESVMPSNHLILCHPLLLLPSVFPSISFFSNESVLHIMWPKDWSFSLSINPSNEYSGLISFRID